MFVNSTLSAIQIIGQRKVFYRQRIPESNQAIYLNNEKTSLENKEVGPVDPVQMNIYRSNTYRKDLSWQCFNERQLVKDQQACIPVFVACPTIPSSNQEQMITIFHAWSFGRFIEIQSNFRRNKFLQKESRLKFSWRQFEQILEIIKFSD